MDKYEGCNIVESVVTRRYNNKKVKQRSLKSAIIRFAVAAAIVGVMCFFAYAPIPALGAVREEIKRVFCYDVFGRSGFGASPIIAKLFGA